MLFLFCGIKIVPTPQVARGPGPLGTSAREQSRTQVPWKWNLGARARIWDCRRQSLGLGLTVLDRMGVDPAAIPL